VAALLAGCTTLAPQSDTAAVAPYAICATPCDKTALNAG